VKKGWATSCFAHALTFKSHIRGFGTAFSRFTTETVRVQQVHVGAPGGGGVRWGRVVVIDRVFRKQQKDFPTTKLSKHIRQKATLQL